jgi:putative endonuclease
MTKGGHVYIMASGPHGTLYIGVTAQLAIRVWQHKQGLGSKFCKENGCNILVYIEEYPTIAEAIAREKAMKAWNRRWKTERISRANPDWRDLYDDLNS